MPRLPKLPVFHHAPPLTPAIREEMLRPLASSLPSLSVCRPHRGHPVIRSTAPRGDVVARLARLVT